MPANRKPKAWNLKPQMTAAPELWRDATVFTCNSVGASFAGRNNGITSASGPGVSEVIGPKGPGLNSYNTSDYIETGITQDFVNAFSAAFLVRMDELGDNLSYKELFTKGSLFRNGTNIGFAYREGINELIVYSRSAGGSLEGHISENELTLSDLNASGTNGVFDGYVVIGVTWAGSTADFFLDGRQLGPNHDTFGSGTFSGVPSGDTIRLMSGTSQSASAEPWDDELHLAIVADRAWSAVEHKLIADDIFAMLRPAGF